MYLFLQVDHNWLASDEIEDECHRQGDWKKGETNTYFGNQLVIT